MTRSLNIAVDARPLAFPFSGIGRYTLSLLREFARHDSTHRFFLYSDRPLKLPFSTPSHWSVRTGNMKRRALSTPFAQLRFPLWARQDAIDVFWSPRHHLPLLLPGTTGTVVTIHDMVWKRYPKTMSRGGRWVEALLMPASMHLAQRIIAVSEFTRQEIAHFYPTAADKTCVIHEASSLPPPSATGIRSQATPYFLFVGSDEPRKNLLRLLEAYALYRAQTTDPVDLLLAGSYQWGATNLEQRAKELGLEGCVVQAKSLDDTALAQLYAGARALVLPSLYEGFGLPLVEAMQMGTPIITSHDTATAEICGNAGLLVDPLDVAALAAALTRMAQDDELHAGFATAAVARSRRFSWRTAAQQTLALIESTITNRPER